MDSIITGSVEARLTIIGPDGSYRDGAEARVLEALTAARDCSSESDELARYAVDWPTRYHLSRDRANLLRPFLIGPGHRVLDIGAGSGAITRYLGETGADVTALEGVLDRARAAAIRCRDLPNVRVVNGSVRQFQDVRGFDLVVCVGVLEYMAGDPHAGRTFLEQLRQLTRPSGALILAIENQLGIRYLLGFAEDHLGEPWAGVEDYAGQRRVRTFGRRQLRGMLSRAGFVAQRWLYAFPDYKHPRAILDESAYARQDAEDLVDKLVRWPSSGEASPPVRVCDDRRAHRVFLREGIGEDVANSFLVVAGAHQGDLAELLPAGFLAQHFPFERKRGWRGTKRFTVTGGRSRVTSLAEPGTESWLSRSVDPVREYVSGRTVEQLALDACADGGEALARVLRMWREHLRTLERPPASTAPGTSPYCRPGRPTLPPEYLDVVLSNFVVDAAGRVHYVDDEWRADGPVDADLVCARALWWFAADLVHKGVIHPFGTHATVDEIADAAGRLCGLPPARELPVLAAEAEFQALVRGEAVESWADRLHHIGLSSIAPIDDPRQLPYTRLVERLRAREEDYRALERSGKDQATLSETVSNLLREVGRLASERDAALQKADAERKRAQDLEAALGSAEKRAATLAEAQEARLAALETDLHGAASHVEALTRQLAVSEARRNELERELGEHRQLAQSRVVPLIARSDRRRNRLRFVRYLLRHPRTGLFVAARLLRPSALRTVQTRVQRLLASGIFDADWYQRRVGLRTSPGLAALHFELIGRHRGLPAGPLFDTAFYLGQNPDVVRAGENPVLHYLTWGAWEGRNPSPLFDSSFYLKENPDVAAARINPLAHFLASGAVEGRSPSPLFDTRYYLEHNPDVARERINPLIHYIESGAAEGRDPNPYFESARYLRENPDVARAGLNPLVHFVLFGAREGRNPGRAFNVNAYLASRPEAAAAGVNALAHYLQDVNRIPGDGSGSAQPVAAGGVFLQLEAPATPKVLKLNEPMRVRGRCRSDGPQVLAVVVRALETDRFDIDLPFSPALSPGSGTRGFETTLRFSSPGLQRVFVGFRVDDGTVDQQWLPPIMVVDDGYCEAMRGHLPTPRVFSVLFVDGVGRTFPSVRYRIDNMREALAAKGMGSAATDAAALYEDLSILRHHDILVLFRAGWDWRLQLAVEYARGWNIPVVFDVDDYVFEPSIATREFIDGIRTWSSEQVEQYQHGVRVYRRSLEEADYFTGSTDFLVDRARELGKSGFVISNHLNTALVTHSDAARDTAVKSDGIEIVYLSGTATHQKDFAQVAPALVDVLAARPQVRLRVIGLLDLSEFPELAAFGPRVVTQDLMPWDALPRAVANAHIAIAPLEIGNPFCEAKSELKFFESAVCGLAVIASATDPFRRAIVDGETGCLCRSADEWRDRLFRLVDDHELRTRMAAAGARHAMERFGPDHAAEQATSVYRNVIADWRRARGVQDSTLSINWIMVDAFAGSGGHNDIFIAANEMAKRGHRVTLFFEGKEHKGNSREIRRFIEKHFGYETHFEIGLGFENITRCDALIATHNSTAHVAQRMRDRTYLPCYFVQDYEPFFSPVNSEYFAAEQTYRYGLFTITLGPWLKDVLKRQHGVEARHIEFWVNRTYYYAPAKPREPRTRPRVLFFARPYMPRRCYELGLAALSVLARNMRDVEICLFGAPEFPGHIDFPYTPLGVLSPSQLGDLYRDGDIGLAFSTTNPSLVTFEMMACGLPLVDLDVFDSRARHNGYPALLTAPSPEAVADGIMRLAQSPSLRQSLSQQGIEFTSAMPSANEALAGVSRIIEDEITARDHRAGE